MALSGLGGFGTGFQYSVVGSKKEELNQGKNYYGSSFFDAVNTVQAGGQIARLNNLVFKGPTGSNLAIFGTSLTSFVVCPALAAARQGHLKHVLPILKEKLPDVLAQYVPYELTPETENRIGSYSDYVGAASKVATYAATVALYTVNPVYSVGVGLPMVFGEADRRGWVPQRIGYLAERYLPAIAGGAGIFGGGLTTGFSALQFCAYSQTFNQAVHNKITEAAKKYLDLPGPTLTEMDASVVINKHLSFDQINKILDTNPNNIDVFNYSDPETDIFKLNPAHCTKRSWVKHTLPQNKDFSKLLELFNSIDWEKKYEIIRNSFLEDDDLFYFLKDSFKEEDETKIKKDMEFYLNVHIHQLNKQAEMSKEGVEHEDNSRYEDPVFDYLKVIYKRLDRSKLKRNKEFYKELHVQRVKIEREIKRKKTLQKKSNNLQLPQTKEVLEQCLSKQLNDNPSLKNEIDLSQQISKTPDQTEKMTPEKFLADRLKKQMEVLVQVLSGTRRAKGSQIHVADSIHNCSQVLHYLLSLDSSVPYNSFIIEDFLMKLAIEGGDYCARGVKRVSDEMVTGLLQQIGNQTDDENKKYENEMQFAFEQTRKQIVERVYESVVKGMGKLVKGNDTDEYDPFISQVAGDVHTLDAYYLSLARGFVYISENDLFLFGIGELYNFFTFSFVRQQNYQDYARLIDKMIESMGHARFTNYLISTINQNTRLSQEEKDLILEKYTERNNDEWSFESTQSRFNRFLCVMWGVLIFQEALPEHWEEVTPPPMDEEWEEVEAPVSA